MTDSVQTSPLVLHLDELQEGSTHLDYQVKAAEIELRDAYFSFPEPLRIDLDVRRTLESFWVEGQICCSIKGECCRCLTEVEQRVAASLKLLFQRKQASDEELEAVAEEEETEILSPGTQEVDLTERVHDAILIELPMRVYCREDCKGLCPGCGRDLNEGTCSCQEEKTDSRWAVLEDIEFS